ncbi:MAG: HD domain-containing protein [Planctomycetes bacterium]|nr:HD domain-containing protein [Planctomycetota bacterium]MBI3833715.1 HD domain-containing protein [Planctomycetota bacterium]
MVHRFINEIKAGDRLEDEVFLVRSKDLRTTTQGGMYIHAVLQDKSGQLVARAWQATQQMFDEMPEGGFLRFKGRAENYKGNLQFIIDALRKAEPGSYESADFIPTTRADLNAMWSRLREILGQIKDANLVALIQEFLADEELMTDFRKAPAAATMHHAYIGGLLEHTLAVLELARLVVPRYPMLSVDLVLTGVFLHDIAKARELCFDTAISYTDDGQLLGHITQAVILIEKKSEAVAAKTGRPFPEQVRWALQHIVLAHHGKYEFGSPKLPAIPEAIVVHYLDNLDAKVHMFLNEIENDKDAASRWSNYNKALETKVYKPDVMGIRGKR